MNRGVAAPDTLPHIGGSEIVRTYEEVLAAMMELRAQARLTQAQLAGKLGVAPSTISAWETKANRMDVDQLAAWARACEHVLRVDLYREGADTREERLLSAVDGLPNADVSALVEVIRVLKSAHPEARHMALNILRSAATTPR